MKRLLLCLLLVLFANPAFAAEKLIIGVTPFPHKDIMEVAKPIFEAQGYTLEIKEFTDYVQPNIALANKLIGANFFQHTPYLDNMTKEKDLQLVSVASVHIEPLGVYSKKIKKLCDLKKGDRVSVPNDPTNEARALLLLQDNGLLKLKDGADLTATVNDIAENPHNIKFVELEAAQVARVVNEVEYVVLNGNYALEAGYSVGKDSIAYEKSDSVAAKTYVNIIGVYQGNENTDKIKALVSVLRSDDIKKFITDKYDGAVIFFEK